MDQNAKVLNDDELKTKLIILLYYAFQNWRTQYNLIIFKINRGTADNFSLFLRTSTFFLTQGEKIFMIVFLRQQWHLRFSSETFINKQDIKTNFIFMLNC